MPLLRKILFYIFAAVYIIACPLLIMYAFGYIFRSNIEKGLVKTGLISFATLPSHATIFLEQRRFASLTPALIRDLIPGKYRAQLALKGYLPWSETVFVEAGKAAVRDKVILLPRSWKPHVLIAANCTALVPVEGTNLLLVAQGPKLGDWLVYDVKKNLIWSLLERDSAWGSRGVKRIYKVKGSSRVLMRVNAGLGAGYLWVDISKRADNLKDVTALIASPPEEAQWSPDEPDTIFVLQQGAIQKINLATGELDPVFWRNAGGYYVFGRSVFVLENDGSVVRTDYDKSSRETILSGDQSFRELLSSGKEGCAIRLLAKGIFLLQNKQGKICVNLPPYQLVDHGVRGYAFSPDTRNLLFWKQDSLGVLDMSFAHYEYIRGMNEWQGGVSWEFQQAKNIRQAFFVYGNSHILFLDNNALFLLGVSGDTPKALHRLFEVRSDSDVFYSEYHGRVYYLDPSSGNLAFVEIAPQKELLDFAF